MAEAQAFTTSNKTKMKGLDDVGRSLPANCLCLNSTRALARAVASKLVCMVACRVLMFERKHPHCSLFLSDFVLD